MARRPPLGTMLGPRLQPVLAFLRQLARTAPQDGDAVMDKPQRLNVGERARPLAGAVNLDISSSVSADVVHDLDKTPWPFDEMTPSMRSTPSTSSSTCSDVVRSLEEIHRIARHGAIVHVTVPHFSSANTFTDVTHRHAFGWHSLDPVLETSTPHPLGHYSRARFRRISGRSSSTHHC